MLRARRIRTVILGLALVVGAGRDAMGAPNESQRAWMQTALEEWQGVCRGSLRLPVEPLPWIIFYDEHRAWHVNPERAMLPENRLVAQLTYNGRELPLSEIDPVQPGELWVPERAPVRIAEAKILTAPYANGAKTYVICALPELVEKSLRRNQDSDFSAFLIGILAHEITHTRQARDVDVRFKRLAVAGLLPSTFDDNIVEKTFSNDAAYRALFEEENARLLTAALQDDEPETGRRLVIEALNRMRERRRIFFTGGRAGFAELDDVFLVMEGIGQWVHFQVVRRHAAANEPWQKTALAFLQRTGSWVQTEGFALFVLIDRYNANWQQRFFAPDFPSPFTELEHAMGLPRSAK